MKTKWNWIIILALLFGLVFTGPKQTAFAADGLTIEPSSLPEWQMTVNFQLQLIARYPGGGECSTGCLWHTTLGSLPEGVSINGDTGLLQGAPTKTGTYTFTVVVVDGDGVQGSQAYTWNITQVKTIVDVGDSSTYVGSKAPTTLGAAARHPNPYYWPQPTGKMSFSVNGVPVPGCSGTESLSTNSYGQAYCTSYVPAAELTAGTYDIQADFTPDTASSATYMSGTGTGTLQVNPRQGIVSGRVFFDDNQNALYDEGEIAQGTWNVNLNQDCDSFLEGDVVTNELTGEFTFDPVPIEGHTYCLSVNLTGFPDGYVQTTPYNDLTLSDYQYFEIGIYFPHISIQPASGELPGGSVGVYYEQTFEISGGTPPYAIDASAALPAGLTFDSNTLTLSGTPTAGGMGQLNISVTDSDGLTASSDYTLRIMADGDFTFTSSANPSALGEAVTFTVSATGEADTPYGKLPPTGAVTFFADGNEIEGCSFLFLNAIMDENGDPIFGNYPVTCTTDALGEGSHEIVAEYYDALEVYNIPSLSLIQQVGVSISPATLPNAEYQTPYNQQLAASGGVEPYYFTLVSGSLPSGISLDATGLLSGVADSPAVPGNYPVTIQVVDVNGDTASTDYDFVLDKGVPTITTKLDANIYWNRPFSISAEVLKKISESNSVVLGGTVAFYIDDIPVPGCGAVTEANGYYLCADASMPLAVGVSHTLKALFTPTGWYTGYYTSGSGSSEFTVQPSFANIPGEVFMDPNQNGVLDEGESRINESGWTVNLDQGCDGTVDYSQLTISGVFNFVSIPVSGQCHRITIDAAPGYQQTTALADFYPGPGTEPFMEIGFFYPTIIVSPSAPGGYTLPSGTIGVEYSQAFTASGGAEPYAYSISSGSLPEGLTLGADGTLSGTPSAAGNYSFNVKAVDANGAFGQTYYSLTIEVVKIDGDFTFTSSANPSAPGEAVTFTVSATGSYATPDGVFPPIGIVTFFADGTEIAGCSNLYLNFLVDPIGGPIFGDYPATCTTDALGEGSHEITATYYDLLNAYNQPSLALTQVVMVSVSANLAVEATDSKDPVKPGSKLTYTLTVSNLGPDAAEGITVTDKLDVTTSFVSVSSPKGWSCSYEKNSGIVACTSASLGSGSTAVIKITVLVDKTAKLGKDLVNTAQVASTTFDPDLLNNSVTQKTSVSK